MAKVLASRDGASVSLSTLQLHAPLDPGLAVVRTAAAFAPDLHLHSFACTGLVLRRISEVVIAELLPVPEGVVRLQTGGTLIGSMQHKT